MQKLGKEKHVYSCSATSTVHAAASKFVEWGWQVCWDFLSQLFVLRYQPIALFSPQIVDGGNPWTCAAATGVRENGQQQTEKTERSNESKSTEHGDVKSIKRKEEIFKMLKD
jgi:hypothetical protein